MSSGAQIPTSQGAETNRSNQSLTPNGKYETAHVLFLDVVGFTRLHATKQRSVLGKLQEIVRGTAEFCTARKDEQLIALPTGDGMALVFLTTAGGSGSAISCAEEIAERVAKYNKNVTREEDAKINVRMGVHSGNVVRVSDVNDRANVAGEGINTAQRVMDCGDTGHILLSDKAVHLLPPEPDRTNECLSLGKVKVKHDQDVELFSLCHNEIGNQETPKKLLLQANEKLRFKEIMAEVEKGRRRRRTLIVVACGLFIVLAALIIWTMQKPHSPPSLAVLPFSPGTQTNGSRAISKGLTEQLIRSFGYLANLNPKTLSPVKNMSNQNLSGQTQSSRALAAVEAGKKLNVRYVLTGTAESKNNDSNLDNPSDVNTDFAIDIQAELYDTDTGGLAWKERKTLSFNELTDHQRRIVTEVTDKMGVSLSENVDIEKLDTKKSSAHWAYLLGRFWSTERPNREAQKLKGEEIAQRAIKSYEKAIEIDPDYALAHAGLADIYVSISGLSMDPTTAKRGAVKATQDAQNCSEIPAQVYGSIGTEKWWLERDFSTARIALLLAIEKNKDFADSHKRYSSYLAAMGKEKDAENEQQLALGMEPESAIIQLAGAQNAFFARRYDQARDRLLKIISTNPKMSVAYRFLAMALEQKNLDQEALDELNSAKVEGEDDPDFLGTRGHIFAHMKRIEEAKKDALSLEKLKKENKSYVSPYDIAVIYAELPNREDDALKWLTTAIIESDPRVAWLKVDPRFTELRKVKESEFNQRLHAAGLA